MQCDQTSQKRARHESERVESGKDFVPNFRVNEMKLWIKWSKGSENSAVFRTKKNKRTYRNDTDTKTKPSKRGKCKNEKNKNKAMCVERLKIRKEDQNRNKKQRRNRQRAHKWVTKKGQHTTRGTPTEDLNRIGYRLNPSSKSLYCLI